MSIYKYDSNFGYRFLPNLEKRIIHEGGGYYIETNEDGFRDNKNFERKKNIKKRILLFGDSFTAGNGVSNDERYSDIIQREFNQYEFYNFAIPGTGTDQQYLIFNEYKNVIEYDYIILACMAENIRRVRSRYRIYRNNKGILNYYEKPFYKLDNGKLILNAVPPQKTPIDNRKIMNIDSKIIDHGGRFPKLNKLAERLNIKELLLRFLPYQPFPEYDKIYSDAWLIMKNIIKMWNEDSKKYFSIFLIPPYQYIEKFSNSKNYINRFDELRLDYDINVVNPLPDLWNYSQSERRHFRFQKDAHLNRDGHIALSKVFKKMIKDL